MRFSFAIAAALFASATEIADATCAATIGAGSSYSTSEDVTLSEGCLKVDVDSGSSITASACPGCIVTDSSGGQTFIKPGADLGCDPNEVNAANPCVTSSSTSTITTTETSSTNDMADMTDMSDMSDQMTSKVCLDSEEGRCYCHSATVSTNHKCIPTFRVTYIDAKTDVECADYCVSECGDGAGSNFHCVITGTPLSPCNEKFTSCDCNNCNPNQTPLEPIQFSGQCGAFCDTFCESYTGHKYSCSSTDTSVAPKIGATVGTTLVVVAVASLCV